jgi:hypothetical protein
MRRQADVAIRVCTLLVFWVAPWCLLAQTQKPRMTFSDVGEPLCANDTMYSLRKKPSVRS